MKPLAALANGAWLAASLPAWQRFRHALANPAETQRRHLLRLLRANAATAYGRAWRFDEIGSDEQFRERVPLVDYDDLAPWIARIKHGERGVLTHGPVTRFVPTSGSSGARKLIPFTAVLQREFNAAIGPWMVDLARTNPACFRGPSYWSISPAIPADDATASAVPIGFDDDSAYLGGVRRRLVEAAMAVPAALRLVTEFEEFRYLTLLCLLRTRELRLVSVWHPSFLMLMLDALPACWDALLQDIERGGCRGAGSLPPEVRRALAAPPQPQRAAELRRLGPVAPTALWPAWRFVSCWGDGQAALALTELQARLPGVRGQAKGLLATEAFVTIPFQQRHPLAVTSHFFEFEDATGKLHLAHDLQAGETYSVIVTTAGGLWRYRLGDLVEVDGWVAATPSLRFLGRGAGVSDLCGEKLSESFVTTALQEAWSAVGGPSRFSMLAPEQTSPGPWRYALFIEGPAPTGFDEALDRSLRKNPHYALCRDLGQLGLLCCVNLRAQAYGTFCQILVSDGMRMGDIKPVALSTRLDWRERFEARSAVAEALQ
ncbi:MAG TPA: GH3 auxin-responsive promoter family protein [Chthoniobacteraceae bacterium]|jgi:hypothetical protein|nr:GH3 auxin-responsive promoter family protein [Chthoniobacteraceae bacterium]